MLKKTPNKQKKTTFPQHCHLIKLKSHFPLHCSVTPYKRIFRTFYIHFFYPHPQINPIII